MKGDGIEINFRRRSRNAEPLGGLHEIGLIRAKEEWRSPFVRAERRIKIGDRLIGIERMLLGIAGRAKAVIANHRPIRQIGLRNTSCCSCRGGGLDALSGSNAAADGEDKSNGSSKQIFHR